MGKCLVHVDWDTKKVTKLHEVEEGLATRFNDGKCDPQGRVWAGMGMIRLRLVSSKQKQEAHEPHRSPEKSVHKNMEIGQCVFANL